MRAPECLDNLEKREYSQKAEGIQTLAQKNSQLRRVTDLTIAVRGFHGQEFAVLRERIHPRTGDDEVVMQGDVYQVQRALQAPREHVVCLAWPRVAGRVVVRQDQTRS